MEVILNAIWKKRNHKRIDMGEIRDRYPMYYKGYPKLYFKRKPIFWWTKKWAHMRFILRELTSVAVAWFSLILIFMIRSLRNGPDEYARFERVMEHPLVMVINVVALVFLIYHSITWFNLAPKAMVIRIGTNKVPGMLIAGLNYVAWLIVSIAVVLLLIG